MKLINILYAPTAAALANSPTFTSPAMLTGVGVILGTAPYMAPEQAKGRPADKRSDIWAFGCVLYEMLTGRRAFEGADVSDTVANVLTREPDWNRLPGSTPPAVRLMLQRCLRKEKRHRLQDAASVRIEIEDALSRPVASAPTLSRIGRAARWRSALVAGMALLGGAVIGGLAVWTLQPPAPSPPQVVARLTVAVPANDELELETPALAVSPNGAHLVYVAKRRGVWQLHLRSIHSLASKVLLGTEGTLGWPFFSPDSQWVGFFAEGKLKKIAVTGGASQVVCDASDGCGGSWAPNGVIYFAAGSFAGLSQVSAAGGTPQPFTTLRDGEISHRAPQVLPGGQAVLFTSRTGPGFNERQVQVQRISSGERRVLVRGDSGSYVPTGHLVYAQYATGTLEAVAFDVTRLRVGAATPVAVAEGLLPGEEGAHYTVSGNGVLAYLAGRSALDDRTLVWVDRHGKAESLQAPAGPYEYPRISPDGTRVAFMTSGAKKEIWVYNLARANATRLLSDVSIQFPIWTPDGKRLTYRATRAGTRNIVWRMADGTGTEERLTTGPGNHAPGAWSPDGNVLLYWDATARADILQLTLSERKTQPFVQTRFFEIAPLFSPDGRSVAYVSDESGPEEIYVEPYPGPGASMQISTGGGQEPVWNPNGRELFYRSGNRMMAVETPTTPVLAAGRPRVLFSGGFVRSIDGPPNYDISREGRFLMVQPSADETATPTQIIVVLNWFEELERLAPHP